MQKRHGNPTSPLMDHERSAIPARFSCLSGTTGSSRLESMSECSLNRCLVESTSSVLWEARLGDGTPLTFVRSASQSCVAYLNERPQPGHLGCQPQPPKVQLEAARAIMAGQVHSTPVEAVLVESLLPTI